MDDHFSYPLVMTNISPWFFDGPNRKFDGLLINSMVDRKTMANC